MAIEIVTETPETWELPKLEKFATNLIIAALQDYECESWEIGLRDNILKTLES